MTSRLACPEQNSADFSRKVQQPRRSNPVDTGLAGLVPAPHESHLRACGQFQSATIFYNGRCAGSV
jgi:hypothetical protein